MTGAVASVKLNAVGTAAWVSVWLFVEMVCVEEWKNVTMAIPFQGMVVAGIAGLRLDMRARERGHLGCAEEQETHACLAVGMVSC